MALLFGGGIYWIFGSLLVLIIVLYFALAVVIFGLVHWLVTRLREYLGVSDRYQDLWYAIVFAPLFILYTIAPLMCFAEDVTCFPSLF
jgi:hypothetical protein